MPRFWFLSVPANGEKEIALSEVKGLVEPATFNQLEIPTFKVGSLDGLVNASEDLAKMDSIFETSSSKLADTIIKLSGAKPEEYDEYLFIDEDGVEEYIRNFTWNYSKYSAVKSTSEIAKQIMEDARPLDNTLKEKMSEYNQLRNSNKVLTQSKTGNLSVRSLDGIVSREHVIEDSEYLETIFIAVPNSHEKEFNNTYETLTQMVVPRSAKKVAQDNDYSLFSVVLFKRIINDFTQAAKAKKFIVREYRLDQGSEVDQQQVERSLQEEQMLFNEILEWAQTSFSEVFSAWVHLKILRIFVESVLLYGIPPDFVSGVLMVPNEIHNKLKKKMNERYAHLDTSGQIFSSGGRGGGRRRSIRRASVSGKRGSLGDGGMDEDDSAFDMNEFHSVLDDYSPYVIFEINWLVSK